MVAKERKKAPGVLPSDIPIAIATRAHSGTSHSPETRGQQEQQSYVDSMDTMWTALTDRAETDIQRGAAIEEFQQLRDNTLQRRIALLQQRSGLFSSFIAGPSKFPVKSQEKKNNAFDKAVRDFDEGQQRRVKQALERVRPSESAIISSDAPGATGQLQAKIDKAKNLQETMKAVNVIVRSKPKTTITGAADDIKIERIVKEVGLTEPTARKLVTVKDFANRRGGPTRAGRLRRPSADLERTAKVVAPRIAKNEKDFKLQKRWFRHPGRGIDFEGVDTANSEKARAFRSKGM